MTGRDNLPVPSSRVRTAWHLKMGPIGCRETTVTNYHSTPRNISEERRSHLHYGILKSRVELYHYSLHTAESSDFVCSGAGPWRREPGLVIVLEHVIYNSCKWPTWRTVLFSYMFIPNRYMFRTLMCSSSGELIVSIRHLVYVTVCRWPSGMQVWVELTRTCIPDGHLHTVTYTRCRIDTINP